MSECTDEGSWVFLPGCRTGTQRYVQWMAWIRADLVKHTYFTDIATMAQVTQKTVVTEKLTSIEDLANQTNMRGSVR